MEEPKQEYGDPEVHEVFERSPKLHRQRLPRLPSVPNKPLDLFPSGWFVTGVDVRGTDRGSVPGRSRVEGARPGGIDIVRPDTRWGRDLAPVCVEKHHTHRLSILPSTVVSLSCLCLSSALSPVDGFIGDTRGTDLPSTLPRTGCDLSTPWTSGFFFVLTEEVFDVTPNTHTSPFLLANERLTPRHNRPEVNVCRHAHGDVARPGGWNTRTQDATT